MVAALLCSLTPEIVSTYTDIPISATGIVLLDSGDEVICSSETYERLSLFYKIKVFEGGCHRFAHMEESLAIIEDFVKKR